MQADEPESSDPQTNYPSQGFSPETPEILKARALAKKPRAGDSPYNSQFEQPPQRIDYFKLDQLQRQAAQNRERTRKRVVLPPDALASLPVANGPGTADNSPEAQIAHAAQSRMNDSLHQGFLSILLLIAVGFLAARKFVPEFNEDMNRLLNPWTFASSADFECSAIVLEEEKSFSEFQARFRVGTPAPGAGGPDGRLGAELFASARRHIDGLQKLVQEARLSTQEATQRKILREVRQKMQPLEELMLHPELVPLQQMTCALELLIKQLTEKAANVTSSTLRTVTQGVDLLADLCQPDLRRDLFSTAPFRFLVVDDEMFSRYALSLALKRTLNAPEVADNVETALEMASRQTYDLIFLDVSMPGMDGFELCAKIHETVPNRLTPVVFVTSLRDFDTRAKSIVCGGRDLISKPFLPFELTVKALTLAARERMRGRGSLADAARDGAANEALPAISPTTIGEAPGLCAGTENAPAKPLEAGPKAVVSPSKLARAFLAQARVQADGLRELVEKIQPAGNNNASKEIISDLCLRVHLFAAGAEASRQQSLFQIGAALEGLVKKLLQNPRNVTTSTLQAVAAAVNLIQELCLADPARDSAISAPIRVLAVDDDPLARRLMTNALQLRFLLPQSAPDGKTALELAGGQPFDVIFLDVQMPDFDGFTVCRNIRQTSTNSRTPVVFVTSSDDPAVRAQACDCGGADFITKPYVCSELTLKTVTFAFRNRLSSHDEVTRAESKLPVA